MTQAIAIAPSADAFLVPEDRVVAMLDTCAAQLERVATIEDAKSVCTVAEAIAAVTRKVEVARRTKLAAVRLLVDAERRLGDLLRTLPRRGPKPKRDVLEEHGINKRRASVAERLAVAPTSKIDKVIEAGANTLHGVTTKLGIHANGADLRFDRASAIAFLCEEAVTMLDRCARHGKVPHAGTVAEMVRRWERIKAHGNKR